MKILTILFSLLGFGSQALASEEGENQLWVMVKSDDYFRSQNEMEVMESVTELIESSGLGELDGHSSGAYQFEFNFYEVSDYEKTKAKIESFINKKYPNLVYTISNDYETLYEKL